MEKNILYNNNYELSYDELCSKTILSKQDYDIQDDNNEIYKNFRSSDSLYTEEESEDRLKDGIYSLIKELKCALKENFEKYDIVSSYNSNIVSYDEVIARIEFNNNILEIKLDNDYMYECSNEINTVYMTLYLNNKGIRTECIERVKEEYEYTGLEYVPINETELYYKEINKEAFVEEVIGQINNLIR